MTRESQGAADPDPSTASSSRWDLLTTQNVRRALDGDRESLDWIVKRFSPLLLAQARYRLGDSLRKFYEPEDIVNAVWLKTLPKLGGLTPRDGRLTPVILRYLATSILREVSQAYRKHFVGASKKDGDADPISDLIAERTGVVSEAIREESRSLLLRAIEDLAPIDREVLVLRAIEQRSGQEVAEILEIEANTLNVRFHRAMKRLRAAMPDSVLADL